MKANIDKLGDDDGKLEASDGLSAVVKLGVVIVAIVFIRNYMLGKKIRAHLKNSRELERANQVWVLCLRSRLSILVACSPPCTHPHLTVCHVDVPGHGCRTQLEGGPPSHARRTCCHLRRPGHHHRPRILNKVLNKASLCHNYALCFALPRCQVESSGSNLAKQKMLELQRNKAIEDYKKLEHALEKAAAQTPSVALMNELYKRIKTLEAERDARQYRKEAAAPSEIALLNHRIGGCGFW